MTKTSLNWKDVSRHRPCPVCGKGSWCTVSDEGAVVVCRRVSNGHAPKTDANGADYWVHLPGGTSLSAALCPVEVSVPAGAGRAEPETLDAVYRELLGALSLERGHRENLRQRGLTDAEIKARGYRSLPREGRAELAQRLVERFGAAMCAQIPGLYVKEGDHGPYWTVGGACGLLIPVRDGRGRVVALKVRSDEPEPEARYSSVSSRKNGGPGPGSPIHMPLFAGETRLIRVTEGELKADVATALSGLLTLGIPGVSVFRPLLPLLRELGVETVRLAFDADAREKLPVARALLATAAMLRQAGCAVELELWPPEAGKGIDDLLSRGGQPEVVRGEPVTVFLAGTARLAEEATAAHQAEGPADTAGSAAPTPEALFELAQVVAVAERPAALRQLAAAVAGDPLAVDHWGNRVAAARLVSKAAFTKLVGGVERERKSQRQAQREAARAEANGAESDTGPYCVRDGRLGIEREVSHGDDYRLVFHPLCNFDARIVAEEVRDNGVDQLTHFTLIGRHCGGAMFPTLSVPAERFPAMSWVTSGWGTRPVVFAGQANKDHLRVALQLLSGEVPRRTIYEHTGWRQVDGRWVYLHAGGALGPEGPLTEVEVALGEQKLAHYALPEPPEGAELVRSLRASLSLLTLAPEAVTYPLLAGIYRAPLGEALPVELSLFLAGGTGAQKSELSAMAQAHYGSGFHAKALPGNWSTTANTLEKQAFLTKDALFTVDDFAPGGTQADVQRLHREADRLFRAQGNRAGRGRMRADGSLRPEYFPRGLVLSSGEDLPQGHSVRARLLILEVIRGDVNLERLTELQRLAAEGVLAGALAGYIRWLAPQLDDLRSMLRERRDALRTEARAAGVSHDRNPDNIASLALGLECLLRFAVEAGALAEAEAAEHWRRGWAALQAASGAQSEHQSAEEPTRRFLDLLAALLNSGEAHVADAADNTEPRDPEHWGWRKQTYGTGEHYREEWRPLGVRIGWLDGENLLLEPEAAYSAAQGLARGQGSTVAIQPRTLWKRLAEKGLLLTREESQGRNLVRWTIAGERKRVLHLAAGSIAPENGPIGPVGPEPMLAATAQSVTPPERRTENADRSAAPAAGNGPVSGPVPSPTPAPEAPVGPEGPFGPLLEEERRSVTLLLPEPGEREVFEL